MKPTPPPKLEVKDNVVTPESWAEFVKWFMAFNKPLAEIMIVLLATNYPDGGMKAVEALVVELFSKKYDLLDTERQLEKAHDTVKTLSGKVGSFLPDGSETQFQPIVEVNSKATGGKYGLGVLKPGNIPACVSGKTQRVFTLPWEQLCRLAIAEGIDERESRIILPR